MDNLPKFSLSRNEAYPKLVLAHFWQDQIYPLSFESAKYRKTGWTVGVTWTKL